MIYEYQEIDKSRRYKLMAQSVIPRPIAWIVTENEGGGWNLAPFSYFTPLSSDPPVMVVSVGHRPDGTPKDTLDNLRRTRRCTLCMVPPKLLEPMHFSSKPLPAGSSEAEAFGIELEEWMEGYPPMVKGCESAFACDLHSEVELEGSATIPLILRIAAQYLDDEHIADPDKLRLRCDFVGRVGPGYRIGGEDVAAPEIP